VYPQYSIKQHFPAGVESWGWIDQHFIQKIIPTKSDYKTINFGPNYQNLMFPLTNNVKVKWPCSYRI
jgi:hypothetical protein